MSETAIRVENIGKLYRLGTSEQHSTLRDSLVHTLGAPQRAWKRLSGPKPAPKSEGWLWALRNISFEVKRGELVGVIGRNGAGKSTLLKVLSRITTPTEGFADITGRVGSLLEVGTGFHPELSGRENIFLNGAILGMHKAEIARKFDEIVAFSEIEQFLDTPIKHYSSGMYMRLAFSVAAHLETEILIVDEVLAVGDAEFQKKCLGKMEDVSRGGRTVLFVSHSMPAIQRLCKRGILLSKGRVEFDGPVSAVVDRYLSVHALSGSYIATADPSIPSITSADADWDEEEEEIRVRVAFESPFAFTPKLGVVLFDVVGVPLFGTNPKIDLPNVEPPVMSKGIIELRILTDQLRADTYNISLWLGDHYHDYSVVENAISVQVNGGIRDPNQPGRAQIGCAKLQVRWRYETGVATNSDSIASV
jgi:lipopolysaccharide transport system ATP-binding protein